MIRKLGTSILVLLLLVFSALIYLIQYLYFHKPDDTWFYFLQDLAFVPISVLLVTLGLNTVMVYRQREQMLQKVSIVINEFFAEAGSEMILMLRNFIVNLAQIAPQLQPTTHWGKKDFDAAIALLASKPVETEAGNGDLQSLAAMLAQKKDQVLRLFENANLLEHDRFTDMLWAVYHVHDELRSRSSLTDLPASDLKHLSGDMQRAIQLLLIEWLESMRQLKTRYPYLYSLAIRKSPLGQGSVIIRES